MTQAVWFSGVKTEEDKDSVKQDLALAYRAFRRLEKILQRKVKEDTSFADYTVANWSHLQADVNGYNRALKEVLKLIKQED